MDTVTNELNVNRAMRCSHFDKALDANQTPLAHCRASDDCNDDASKQCVERYQHDKHDTLISKRERTQIVPEVFVSPRMGMGFSSRISDGFRSERFRVGFRNFELIS